MDTSIAVKDEASKPRETAAEIVTRAMTAYERHDWDTLKALTHPDAEVEMLLLEGGATHGPDELSDTLREAGTAGIHRPTATSIEDVAPDAAAMVGRIQRMDSHGGISDRDAVWLSVLRDGKIWRSRVLGSLADVPSAYEEITGHPPVSPESR
jgi:ketosteroid isomerase-like protein